MTAQEIPPQQQPPRPIISGGEPRLLPRATVAAPQPTTGGRAGRRMLDPALIPTRLIDPADRKPIRIIEPKEIPRYHVLHVAWIFLIWAGSMVMLLVRGRLSRTEYARHFRRLLETLGGLWIKAGQLLSLRTDIFSTEFCEELSKLQFQATGFPAAVARTIVEEDLGAPIEHYFDHWDELPFAAASIGQLHRAHLKHEDVWVAVKVQRPEMPKSFAREVAVIRFVVRALRGAGFRPHMRWDGMLWELTEIIKEEINYHYEAASMRRMRKGLRSHGIYVPKVFSDYCTPRVLVMEFIPGVLMSDFIQTKLTDETKLNAWLAENEVDSEVIARRLINTLFRQLFEDNLYHGDLHPGNIILLRKNKVALIDFGSIGFTDREFLDKYTLSVRALSNREYEKAADLILLLCPPLPRIDLDTVKDQLIRALRSWATRTRVRELPYHEKSIGAASDETAKVLYYHKIPLDWAFLRIRRAVTTLDASLIHLFPDVNYVKIVNRFFRKVDARATEKMTPQRVAQGLVRTMGAAQGIGEQLGEFALFRAALIRRQAQLFDGATSKVNNFLAVACWNISLLLLVAGIMNASVFAYQYYPDLYRSMLGEPPGGLFDLAPRLPYAWWIIFVILDFYFFVVMLRLNRRFREKESRQPDAGTNL
jgi:ubiquinone biosynthesis protein